MRYVIQIYIRRLPRSYIQLFCARSFQLKSVSLLPNIVWHKMLSYVFVGWRTDISWRNVYIPLAVTVLSVSFNACHRASGQHIPFTAGSFIDIGACRDSQPGSFHEIIGCGELVGNVVHAAFGNCFQR